MMDLVSCYGRSHAGSSQGYLSKLWRVVKNHPRAQKHNTHKAQIKSAKGIMKTNTKSGSIVRAWRKVRLACLYILDALLEEADDSRPSAPSLQWDINVWIQSAEEGMKNIPCRPLRVWPSFLQLLSHRWASYRPVQRCLQALPNQNRNSTQTVNLERWVILRTSNAVE